MERRRVQIVVRGNILFAMQKERKNQLINGAPRLDRSVGTFYMLCNPIHLKQDFCVNENIMKQSLVKILWKKMVKKT
jgi:hypothetical protein